MRAEGTGFRPKEQGWLGWWFLRVGCSCRASLKYLGGRTPSALPGVRITPLAERKKGIPSADRARHVTQALSEGLGWSLLCPDSPARARGPLMNTATSQFGRMPEWTIGAGAWGVWLVVIEPRWAGSWAHFKGWGGGLFLHAGYGLALDKRL